MGWRILKANSRRAQRKSPLQTPNHLGASTITAEGLCLANSHCPEKEDGEERLGSYTERRKRSWCLTKLRRFGDCILKKMQQSWKVREMDPGADVDQQPVRSLQDQHELTNQGPSARLEILSDNTTTVPIHPYVAPLDTEQGVQNLDGNAKLATLNSKQSQERTQQSTDNEVEVATPLDVQTTGIAGPGPVDESMTGQPEPDELLTSPDLETQFKIIFHLPNNETLMRCAQLDTGAKGVNLLSQDVMDDLKEYGLPMEPYEGPKIKPLGALIKPMGQIKLPWSVRRFPKTYSHTFLVLDSQSTSGFDALLGDTTINQVGFFIRNHKVWLSDQQRV